MKKTHIGAGLVSALIGVTLLAGCGTGTGPTPGGSQGGDGGDLQSKIAAVTDDQLKGQEISLGRMFGDCEETTQGVTDPAKATNECEAIQILTNKFNAENTWGLKVTRLGGTDWNSYYDAFNAAIAGGQPPNIANLHDYALSDYASRDQLLTFDPTKFGIDIADATAQAQKSIQYDGKTAAVPFDSHAILAHVNTDILGAAGYMDADGRPIMPTSPDELLAMGKAVKEKTGKLLFSMGFPTDDMSWRVFYSLVRQQGADLITNGKATVNSEAATKAMELLSQMIDAGYISTKADYSGSIDEWKNQGSAILVNGTWVVNEYAAMKDFGYTVTDFPTIFGNPAVWASSHMWVIPKQSNDDPVKYRAALEFAKFLFDNTGAWAEATGHNASRVSVIESAAYQKAPNRQFYTDTALKNMAFVPQVNNWTAIKDLIHKQLEEVWFNGKDLKAALDEAQSRVERALK
ncbi:MAG: hypothetical protein LBV00_10460 [Propionibacteriaceae bacterium]|jgi:multiple sugar transport system substrate-binding protein|nr:hypothetical protein [Propionibacteriaceae bacterium]